MTDLVPVVDETVSLASTSGQTMHVSRKLLSNFKGSWFDAHFGQPGPITYPRWTKQEKSNRLVYHLDVPSHVLEAFVQLHALPELFPLWTTQLPDCCTYGIQLDVWLRYMAQYFSNQMTLLKRPHEDEGEENTFRRDFSRPPKRFRRDFKEWEVGKAFIQWILDTHPHATSFLDCETEQLAVVMPRDQKFPLGEKQLEVLSHIFDNDKVKRIKTSLERIILSHHDLSIKVDKFDGNVSGTELFNYPHRLSRERIWPVNGNDRLSIDDRFMLLTLTWEDWNGTSV
jgi:hypothetical protein